MRKSDTLYFKIYLTNIIGVNANVNVNRTSKNVGDKW